MQKLAKKIAQFQKQVQKRVNVGKIQFAKLIALNLIMATPVDTSKALSNWIANIQSPKAKVRPPLFLGIDGSTFDRSSSMAYSMALTTIQRAKIGQVVYITNNVDYIRLLNEGYSSQAESDFILHCVQKSVQMMKKVNL